jgi:hypothetical protein
MAAYKIDAYVGNTIIKTRSQVELKDAEHVYLEFIKEGYCAVILHNGRKILKSGNV